MHKEIKEQVELSESALPPGDDAGQPAPATTADESGTPDAKGLAPASVEAPLSPEQITELKAKAAKADEHWDRLLRQTADFDNYRKRAARERQDAVKYANQAILEKLIPVLDHFDMAMASAKNPQGSASDSFQAGINLIYSQLKTVVMEAGLEEIDATNQPFDPNWHEAVSHQESTEAPENQVLQQLRKGYKLRDRLLRPASVIVAKKPPQ